MSIIDTFSIYELKSGLKLKKSPTVFDGIIQKKGSNVLPDVNQNNKN